MAPDKDPKITEKLIGNMTFGFTLESVQGHLNKMGEELKHINEALSKDDIKEDLRKHGEERKLQLEHILGVPADEILRLLQMVYDCVYKLEKDGKERSDIILEMNKTKPELIEVINKFYDFLRSQTWGYRVGQYLFLFQTKASS